MKAMILSGGLSTRLYPLTKAVPKPLVPVGGIPNAVHVINYLRSYGYDEIAINVHYLADSIVEALGDGSRFGVTLHYLHEEELMGSAGSLKALESYFGNETFAVVGCDDLTNLPLDRMLAFHRKRNALATIGLVDRERVDQYGVVVTDEHGKIVGFQEKPEAGTERSHCVNTGIYLFEPGIFSHIPARTFYDFGKQVFPALQQAGEPFFGFAAGDAYWCDIGTIDEYRRASNDIVNGRIAVTDCVVGIAPSATVASTAHIEGPVHIGARARIGEGTRITGPCVIGDDTIIERGVILERSILWDRAWIGAGATVRDSIVGVGYQIANGARIESEVLAKEPVVVPS